LSGSSQEECFTNRLLYQLSYVGFWLDRSSLSNRRRRSRRRSRLATPYRRKPPASAPLCGASGDQGVVFLLRLGGQQNPHGVHADGRTEGNVEQRDEAQDECDDASPGFPLH